MNDYGNKEKIKFTNTRNKTKNNFTDASNTKTIREH